jgi:1-acyl-sn-glycerol-3-phosphate acyltransferase
MWFTAIVILDVFLAWFLTTWIINGFVYLFGIPMHLPRLIMEEFYVPNGFITLVYFLPNLLLVAVYFMFSLPRSEAFRSWKGFDRFRFPIIISGEPAKEQVVYAACPHGIHGEGTILHMVLSRKDVTVVASSLLFYIPIVREFANLAGAMPANTATIAKLLESGKTIVMLPEGLRGAIHPPGDLSVLRGIPGECQPRKGFVRCAVSAKVPIVPIYMDGVDKLYTTYHVFPWLQKLILSRYYYPWFILNFGWYGTFWPKLHHTVHVKYGKTIPTAGRDVDEVFEDFLEEMEHLAIARCSNE